MSRLRDVGELLAAGVGFLIGSPLRSLVKSFTGQAETTPY